jgi:hypothetical protein
MLSVVDARPRHVHAEGTMLRRLLVGLLIGLFIGGLAAAALMKGLSEPVLDGGGGAVLAYVFAAITGVVTGLVAGKPIWASGGQIEAGLKAVFGALLAAGAMFALRQWAGFEMNLSVIDPAAHGALGMLPATTLPLIGAVLGGFYELDNTGTEKADEKKLAKGSVSVPPGANGKVRVDADPSEAEDEPEPASKKARR